MVLGLFVVVVVIEVGVRFMLLGMWLGLVSGGMVVVKLV